jgi:hypothetical protein
VSRVDDGSRSLDGLTDRGVQSHGVCRAGTLRPGQQLKCGDSWYTLESVDVADGKVTAKSAALIWGFPDVEMVPVRDILHTYTESDTP